MLLPCQPSSEWGIFANFGEEVKSKSDGKTTGTVIALFHPLHTLTLPNHFGSRDLTVWAKMLARRWHSFGPRVGLSSWEHLFRTPKIFT